MRKNFTFLFLMGIFGLFSTNLFAQQDASIDPANIRYWIGEGENEVVFAVNWNEPDTCLAWGYRFSEETVTVKHVMDAIAEVDPRFSYVDIGWGVGDIYYEDGVLNLALYGTYWLYNINGEQAMLGPTNRRERRFHQVGRRLLRHRDSRLDLCLEF